MPISIEAAEKITGIQVFGFGFGLVFVGLISLIIICSIMGAVCKKLVKEKPEAAKLTAPAPKAETIPNKVEFIAAVSAALAEELGNDVSKIRILSVKKL